MWENISLELWGCAHMFCCICVFSPSRFPCVCGVVSCQGSTFYPHVWHSSSQGSQRNNTLHTREPCNCHHIHTLWSTQKWTNPQGWNVFSLSSTLQLSLFCVAQHSQVSEALICKKFTLFYYYYFFYSLFPQYEKYSRGTWTYFSHTDLWVKIICVVLDETSHPKWEKNYFQGNI